MTGKLAALATALALALMFVAPLSALRADATADMRTEEHADLATPAGEPILTVAGAITRTNHPQGARFDLDLLRMLPPHRVQTTTSVTDGPQIFDGVLVRDLLALVGAAGETVIARALNDYVVEIPVEDFQRFDVLLAHSMNGEALSPRSKGPLWIVYPRDDHAELQDIRYDYRWVWQLNRMDVR